MEESCEHWSRDGPIFVPKPGRSGRRDDRASSRAHKYNALAKTRGLPIPLAGRCGEGWGGVCAETDAGVGDSPHWRAAIAEACFGRALL